MDVPLLSADNVEFTYLAGTPLQQPALRGVNLQIREGESVALMGASGSGKSTLTQHFNGLLLPTRGRILVAGQDTGAHGVDLVEIRRQIAVLFQYPEHQLFDETVARDVSFGPRNLGLPAAEVDRRCHEAMHWVGLPFELYRDRSPLALSGGEMRRVALAGVLAMEPRALVLDEPTAGLDAAGKQQLVRIVEDLRSKRNLTLILVTHDVNLVAELAERLIILESGRIVADGAVADIVAGDDAPGGGVERPAASHMARRLVGLGIKIAPATVRIADLAEGILRAWRVGRANAESL